MKKPNNLTLLAYILGIAFALFSAIRYFLLYPDTDRALVYVVIGLLACGVGFLYDKIHNLNIEVEAVSTYLADNPLNKQGEVKEDGNI